MTEMSTSARRFAKIVRQLVEERIRNATYRFSIGLWVAAETEDANLSQIQIDDRTHRHVWKLKSVTGLAANDLVLVLYGPGLPLTIVGTLHGDISLAV